MPLLIVIIPGAIFAFYALVVAPNEIGHAIHPSGYEKCWYGWREKKKP